MPDHPFEKVLITGGTGFLGAHLARALLRRGVIPLLVSRTADLAQLPPDLRGCVRLAAADVRREGEWESLLRAEQPTTLFHLAGARGNAPGAALRCAEVNVTATARVLESAHRYGVGRIVLAGSAEEYGPQPGPLSESQPVRPASIYGITKAAGTALALALAEQGCPVAVVRPFTVYGPGQPEAMFLSAAFAAALAGQPFAMTEGRQRRDLVYVTDVAEGLLAAALAPNAVGRVINLGTGQAHRLCDVAQRIWQLTGTNAPLQIGARPAAAHELYDTWADLTLARQLLGWSPQVDLEKGLLATLDYLLTHQPPAATAAPTLC